MGRLPRTSRPYLIGCAALAVGLAAAPTDGRAQQGQNELSLEQHYRLFPPPPVGVTAEIRDGKVVVSWQKPDPPPSGKIGYDPTVVRYQVYRLGKDEHRTLVGKSTGTTFTDPARLRPGTTRRYGVTAVQRSGEESGMSAEAELQIPRAR